MFNRKKQKIIAAVICGIIVLSMVITMVLPYLSQIG